MENILAQSKHKDFVSDLILWGKLNLSEIKNIFQNYSIIPSVPELFDAVSSGQAEKIQHGLKGLGVNDSAFSEGMELTREAFSNLLNGFHNIKDSGGNAVFHEGKSFSASYEEMIDQIRCEKNEVSAAIGGIKKLLKSKVITETTRACLTRELLHLEPSKQSYEAILEKFNNATRTRIMGPRNARKRTEYLKFLVEGLVDLIEPARERILSHKPYGDAPYLKKTSYSLIAELLAFHDLGTLSESQIETLYQNSKKVKK